MYNKVILTIVQADEFFTIWSFEHALYQFSSWLLAKLKFNVLVKN